MRVTGFIRIPAAALLIGAMFAPSLAIRAGDIVATEDVISGSSVFVFRKSRKQPQESRGFAGRVGARKGNAAELRARRRSAAAERRRTAAVKRRKEAAAAARARARVRSARLRLASSLAASGDSKLDAGDIAGAIADYRSALKNEPSHAGARTGLSAALTASALQSDDDSTGDLVQLKEAVSLDPTNSSAYAELGERYSAASESALAAASFEKALSLDPSMTWLNVSAAAAYAQAGDTQHAQQYLARARAAGSDTAEIELAMARGLAEKGDNTGALAAIERVVSARPNDAASYHERGIIQAQLGMTDQASDSFRRAIALDPNSGRSWFELGVIAYNAGNYPAAADAYRNAVKADPNDARAHANLASTYRQMERYPEANAAYKIAAVQMDKDPDLYSEWGFCLGKTAEWDKAVARLETAEQLGTTAEDDSNVGWAYYNAAQADRKADRDQAADQKLQKSKESLEAAVQKDPNLDAAQFNLGATYNSLGEYDKAVRALNEAVRINSDWVVALNQLGVAYRGNKNYPLALQTLNRAVTLDANNVVGLFHLGATQSLSGDKSGAKRTQSRLKKLRPDLADQLGNVIAGRAIDFGLQKLRTKIRIPGLPF